ncbi:MAG: hypothetical protein KAG66_02340 [Methylococcales bacterium]|nr:hypothetical protein [Methylococcales bacterium]
MQQGDWEGSLLTPENWRDVVRQRIQPISWPLVLEDVESFIIDVDSQHDFNKERLLDLLDMSHDNSK